MKLGVQGSIRAQGLGLPAVVLGCLWWLPQEAVFEWSLMEFLGASLRRFDGLLLDCVDPSKSFFNADSNSSYKSFQGLGS